MTVKILARMKSPTPEDLKIIEKAYDRLCKQNLKDHERATKGLYYMSRMIPEPPRFYDWISWNYPKFKKWAEWMQAKAK